jgi:predicted DNA-binding protein (MmcQ/YjbR family)
VGFGYNGAMPTSDPVLAKVRSICLALPDTKETMTWGQPHFRVRDKIFAGYGEHEGKASIGFKLTKPHADAVVNDPRFERAPYVGKHGWVSLDAKSKIDWASVRGMIHESYSLIAPPSALAKLGKKPAKARAASRGGAAKKTARKRRSPPRG